MKQNDDNTEFLIIGTKTQLEKVNFGDIDVCEATITAADSVKNLGILFDKEMSLKYQVNNMFKMGFFNIRSQYRNHLTLNHQKKLSMHLLF